MIRTCRGGHPTGAAQQVPVQTVPNYLVQAILTTLFCCLPLGIVSIVFATQVNSKLSVGDATMKSCLLRNRQSARSS